MEERKMVSVDAKALYEVLQAVLGPPHYIRELQMTRSIAALTGEDPIQTLVDDFNRALQPKDSPPPMTDEIKLPEPAAWREDDGHWLYYDETNSPSTFKHISEHQKDAHEKSVFALFTADQVRAAVLEAKAQERERCATLCEEHAHDAWDHEGGALWCAAAIRSGRSITETKRAGE